MRALRNGPRSYGRSSGGSCATELRCCRFSFSHVVSPRRTKAHWKSRSVSDASAVRAVKAMHSTALMSSIGAGAISATVWKRRPVSSRPAATACAAITANAYALRRSCPATSSGDPYAGRSGSSHDSASSSPAARRGSARSTTVPSVPAPDAPVSRAALPSSQRCPRIPDRLSWLRRRPFGWPAPAQQQQAESNDMQR
eukprot:scaffold9776_cov126-Isochrysis_galbana.AAC.14